MSEQTIPVTEVSSAPRSASRTLTAREAAATKLVASADLATHSHQRLLRPSGRVSGSEKHAHEVSSQCHHPVVLVLSDAFVRDGDDGHVQHGGGQRPNDQRSAESLVIGPQLGWSEATTRTWPGTGAGPTSIVGVRRALGPAGVKAPVAPRLLQWRVGRSLPPS